MGVIFLKYVIFFPDFKSNVHFSLMKTLNPAEIHNLERQTCSLIFQKLTTTTNVYSLGFIFWVYIHKCTQKICENRTVLCILFANLCFSTFNTVSQSLASLKLTSTSGKRDKLLPPGVVGRLKQTMWEVPSTLPTQSGAQHSLSGALTVFAPPPSSQATFALHLWQPTPAAYHTLVWLSGEPLCREETGGQCARKLG